jgi:hypothetical protein
MGKGRTKKMAKWDLIISKHYGDKWQADLSCPNCEFMKYNIWSGFFPNFPDDMARNITQKYAEKVKTPNYCENCGVYNNGEMD